MKIINPRIHGYIDIAVVALLVLAPTLLSFGGRAASLCYVLAGVQAALTALTAYPMGWLKMIPFPVHGGLEAAMAPALAAAPWLVGFANVPTARIFFLAAGGSLAVVWLLTDYKATVPRAHDEIPHGHYST